MHKHASTNRFYRLVWSHVHACWVAVAEGARGRGKSASRKLSATLIGGLLSAAALAAGPGPTGIGAPQTLALPGTHTLPSGAQVVAGQASVTSTANQMTVQQGSDKAILNWHSFDIGAGAAVRFVQPSATAVALNRVLGPDSSRIYGQLSANGQVFLVNGSGVLFGASARVDVGSLVASSLALPDGEFLAGRYTFGGTAKAGAVRNEGSIRTANGGYVALLGPSVQNAGSIQAPNGSVTLGAGEQVGIDLRGDGLVTLRVERGALDAVVANGGLVQADGGRVELSARGADALARATVNNTGLIQARGLVADGGGIRLAGDGDVHAGALDVSSGSGRGGQVALDGNFVALDGAIDASGADGGLVNVNAASGLSAAASTRATGHGGSGGAIVLRSGGSLVESASAASDAGGVRAGGSVRLHGAGEVLSSASHKAASQEGGGGRIDISGADVRLFGAQLDASGATQGGLVRVGGAFQGGAMRADAPDLARFVTRWGGNVPIANATTTFVGDGSAIKVGASGAGGQGGTAVVWSERQTTMLGSIDARGAAAAGTVEISSKDTLRHVGLERVALGAGGQLLLDPKNIVIGSSAGAWTYQAILGKGYTGSKRTDVAGLEQGDGFGASVALNAAGDRMAVGAPFDDGAGNVPDNATERGAVRLFSFTDTNFSGATLQGTIGSGYTGGKNLNVALDDYAWFGSAVALNANATRLAVGAPTDAGGLGSVRLISFGGADFAAPALTHTLRPDTLGLPNAVMFGASVALNGTGDRLAVGSLFDSGASGACSNCGAVYLFNNALASPAFSKAIGAGYAYNLGLTADAQFGTALAFDASGDKLAVGAIGAGAAGSGVSDGRGAVYLFNNVYGGTAHVATLGSGYSGGKNLNVTLAPGAAFGSSVAFNGAGTRLAVGTTGAGGGNGNVRIVDFADSAFSAPAIKATLGSGNTEWAATETGLEDGEHFGFALALNAAGDRLVVGSPYSDGALEDNGGYGTVRAFALQPIVPASLLYSTLPDVDVTLDAAMLSAALDNGTSITLQANNDIVLQAGHAVTVADGSGNGALRLQAGRSIALDGNITTGNANLTLVANDTLASGVADAYRDAGAAAITVAAGTTVNAGTGQVSMTIADGAGKTQRGSGALAVNGTIRAREISLKNLGPSAGSNVTIGASGNLTGSASGTIEVAVAGSGGGSFVNNAGAAGLAPGAGRYLVYSNNPGATLEGVSGYNKRYNAPYTGSTPAYAASGNWFLYAVAPVLNVSATPTSKVYDGTLALPALGYGVTGLIDGDSPAVLSGALAVNGLTKHVGSYAIGAGSLANALGYTINYTGANLTVTPRPLNATVSALGKTYDGNATATVSFGDDRVSGDVFTIGGSAAFADKHAGDNKPVNVGAMALSGTDAANYQLASTTATTSASIAKRVLTPAVSAQNKVYDGTAAATIMWGGDDRVSGDDLFIEPGSAAFADKHVGTAKTVTVSGYGLVGADAGNYRFASDSINVSANIAPRNLTATVQGIDKVYDGNASADVVFNDNRAFGDVLSLSGSATFSDRHVGNGKFVSVAGMSLSGPDAGNYNLVTNFAMGTANITRRVLNVSAAGIDKTYDGTASATVSFGDDRIAGDLFDLTSSASFANKHAGSGKTITVSGLALSGTHAGNYSLATNTASTSAAITPRSLVVHAAGIDKVYDGNTTASVNLGDNRIGGDLLDLGGSASFASKHAGSGKAVQVTGLSLSGADANNYTLASTTAATSASITPRMLAVSASALDKTYDGTTNAQFGVTDDRIAGDLLSVSGNASFADKHAGGNKAVAVANLALSGLDAGNYTLASSVAASTASIAPRALVVGASGADKVYDGNVAASVTLGDDRIGGDVLDLAYVHATFVDRHAGVNKAVNVSGISIGGADAGNYSLVASTAGASATITPRSLVVGASGIDKTYDGNTDADVLFTDDRIGADVLALSGSASFADKHAGSGKLVSVNGIVLAGADAGNYRLASTTASTSASIAKRVLNVSASGVGKTYDGTTQASVSFGDDRIAGDLLDYTASASFADKHAGSAKAVGVTGIGVQGLDAGNYVLATDSVSTQADIARRSLVVSASGIDKVYDGNTTANVTFSDDRVGGDLLDLSASASFADKHAGSGKGVRVDGLALAGADANNYTLASASVGTRASITPRTLAVSATALDKTYDGTINAQVGMSDDRIAGDLLSVTGSASFSDKHVGTNKAVSVSGLALSGLDAGNYTLASGSAAGTASITPRALVVGATGTHKTYDGTASASVVLGDDRIGGDVLDLAYLNAAFADKHAGANKAIQVSGIRVGGLDAGNYSLAANTATASATIAPRSLVVSARAAHKVYDGNTAASVAFTDNRVAGDLLDVSGNAAFADKHAGNGKAVHVDGIALAGLDAGNYTLASTPVGTRADITPRTLAVSASALDKTYDGTTNAQFGITDDRIAGDLLSVSGNASFADKHAGSNKAVAVANLALSGLDAGNYTLASSVAASKASITPRALLVTASGAHKTYDGNTSASVALGDDRIGGDVLDLAYLHAAFADKHAGANKAIQVAGIGIGGLDAGNYSLVSSTAGASASITPRSLVVGATGVDKTYDGNTDAGVVFTDNRIGGDLLHVSGTGMFSDKHAGSGKRVEVGNLALSGLDAGNYALAAGGVTTTATIAPKALAATIGGAVTKTYDGGTRVRLDAGQALLEGFVAGEGATVGALDAAFDSADVLQARAVRAPLAAEHISAADGTQLANYVLPAAVEGAGSVTPRSVSVTGMRAAAKVYDGGTDATLADIGTLAGLVSGESLQLGGPVRAAFASRGAGTGKLVTASGYRLADGVNGRASNYVLAGQVSTFDGVIEQATLTVKAGDATRIAGRANPAFAYSVSGLVDGDSAAILPPFSVASSADTASAPGSYAIQVSAGGSLADYRFALLDGVLTVTAAPAEPTPTPTPTPMPAPVGQAEPVRVAVIHESLPATPRRASALPVAVAGQASLPPQHPQASVLTLSGGTEILAVDGGVRTQE